MTHFFKQPSSFAYLLLDVCTSFWFPNIMDDFNNYFRAYATVTESTLLSVLMPLILGALTVFSVFDSKTGRRGLE